MATTTAKGIPVPELSDPPNGPDQIGALADWVDAMLTGTNGQYLKANSAAATDVEWGWPGGRVVTSTASVTSPAVGALVWQTGAPAGPYMYGGGALGWVRLTPDLLRYSRGYIDRAIGGAGPGTSNASLASLGPVTLDAGRRYELRGHVNIQATESLSYIQASAEIRRTDGVVYARFPTSNLLTTPVTNTNGISDALFAAGSIAGDGSSQTFEIRVFKVLGDASGFQVPSVWLELYDVGDS